MGSRRGIMRGGWPDEGAGAVVGIELAMKTAFALEVFDSCPAFFKERAERGTRIIDCVFAERRALVYEIFVSLLAEQTMN